MASNPEQTENSQQIIWLLDSGCTDHIINNDKFFEQEETLKKPIEVKVGDGRVLQATKIGRMTVYFPLYSRKSKVTLKNVFYVKDMRANLLSYSKITEGHTIVSKGESTKIYKLDGELVAIAKKENRLYRMTSYVSEDQVQANVTQNIMTKKEKLHRTLRHVNFKSLDIMCKEKLLEGLPEELESDYLICAICIQNKMHNLPFQNNRRRAEDILEIVHTDLNGPHRTAGCHGEKYFLSFIDDYSKLIKIYCI